MNPSLKNYTYGFVNLSRENDFSRFGILFLFDTIDDKLNGLAPVYSKERKGDDLLL